MEVVVWGRLRGGEVGVRRGFEKKKIAGMVGGGVLGKRIFLLCVTVSI